MDADIGFVRRWGRPLSIGLFGLAAFVLVVVGFYVSIFNTGLSHKSDSWSDAGSFFGGLIGPGISLITLIALLRTIDLQLEQSAHFVADGVSARLAEYKTTQLQMLDQQILMFERMLDRYDLEGERIFNLPRVEGSTRVADLKQADKNIQETDEQVGRLIKLSVEISLSEFQSIEQLRVKIKKELESINPHVYKIN
jgi:hypothetical protein